MRRLLVLFCLFAAACHIGEGPPDDVTPGNADAGTVDDPRADADPGAPDAPSEPACGWVKPRDLGGEQLNVRAEPATGSDIVGTVTEAMVLEKLDEATGDLISDDALGRSSDLWYQIQRPSYAGWITAVYAECTSAPLPSDCGLTVPDVWVWATPGNTYVGQPFNNPISYQSCGFHTGIDVGGATGDPIVAVADGEVVHVGPMWLSGTGQGRGPYAIIIEHGPDLYSTYSHNSAAHVDIGDCVEAGELIADIGSLGYSSGPHIHFEMVEGTPWTGDWMTPFAGACDHYRDPLDFIGP